MNTQDFYNFFCINTPGDKLFMEDEDTTYTAEHREGLEAAVKYMAGESSNNECPYTDPTKRAEFCTGWERGEDLWEFAESKLGG